MAEHAHDKARQHTLIHHREADGYIALAKKTANGFRQYHYKADQLSTQLSKWLGEDVYFSQNTFYKPERQIENIRQLRALYADVDCYLLNYDPEWVVGKIQLELIQEKFPDPNLIIYSGRGLALVWLIEPLPYKALPLWQTIQHYFLEQLKEVGGDPKASDAARIFRVAGSINSANGEIVEVQYRHNYRYALRDIQEEYLPKLKTEKKPRRGRPSKVQRLLNTYSLYHARLMDITKLVELRDYDVKGHRELICFLYRYWLCCYTNDTEEAIRQTQTLNLQFREPLPLNEVERATRSAEKAYFAMNDEEADRIAKEKGYPGAGYRVGNRKLINWLEISDDEQRQLKTIISKEEKNRRRATVKRTERRSEGILERGEYLHLQKEKTSERIALLKRTMQNNPDASIRELAKQTGLSVGYVHKLKKEI